MKFKAVAMAAALGVASANVMTVHLDSSNDT